MTNALQLMLVLGAVLVFVLGLVYGLTAIARGRPALPADPERVLGERFAKGEIDEKEYARRLTVLRYGPPLELPD